MTLPPSGHEGSGQDALGWQMHRAISRAGVGRTSWCCTPFENERFEELERKYMKLQDEYIPSMSDRIAKIHEEERNKEIERNIKEEEEIIYEQYNKSKNNLNKDENEK